MASIGGLGSGIDTASIVNQLMSAERLPQQRSNALRLAALSRATAWTDLETRAKTLRTAAEALDTGAKVRGATATSSDPTSLAVTSGPGAQLGSVGIRVDRLATAQLLSSPPLASPDALAGAGTAVVSRGLAAIGATSLKAGPTATAGAHTVQVLQPSDAARAHGSAIPTTSFSGESFTVTVSGTPRAVTLNGSYDADQLADEIGRQLGSSVQVQNEDGQLVLSSREHGSGATLALSGSGLAAVGLVAATTTGEDATLLVDGVERTVTRLGPGVGDVDLGGGLSLSAERLVRGTLTATVVRTDADTTVAELAGMLSAAGGPSSAALVNTGAGGADPYRIVLSASQTGTAGALTIETSGTGLLAPGQLAQTRGALDAQLVVGTTPVTRSSNRIDDLLPGVTLTLLKPTTTDVTVDTGRDVDGLVKKVQALVDGLNGVLGGVATQTAYDVKAGKGAPLAGNGSARGVASQALALATGTTGPGATKVLSQAGITVGRDGRLSMDAEAFKKALAADPEGVGGLVTAFSGRAVEWVKGVTAESGAIASGKEAAGRQATARQQQIDEMETRLADTERRYKMQFARLDAAMGQLTAQSSRLASQIGSLPSYGS